MVKYDLAKVEIRVRFPVPALKKVESCPHRSVDRIQASEACDRGSTPRGGITVLQEGAS